MEFISRVCAGLMILLAARAGASEGACPPSEGRGWIFGAGLGGGAINFDGAADLAAVIGGPIGTLTIPFGGQTITLRSGQIVSRDFVPLAGDRLVPIPSHQQSGVLSLQVGRSLSRRMALLADIDLMAGWNDSFSDGVVGFVGRYSPASRFWLEAGPAFGDLSYGLGRSVAQNLSGTGGGVLAAAGVVVTQKPKWQMDVQGRVGVLWYDQFRATNISVQLGVMRRRS